MEGIAADPREQERATITVTPIKLADADLAVLLGDPHLGDLDFLLRLVGLADILADRVEGLPEPRRDVGSDAFVTSKSTLDSESPAPAAASRIQLLERGLQPAAETPAPPLTRPSGLMSSRNQSTIDAFRTMVWPPPISPTEISTPLPTVVAERSSTAGSSIFKKYEMSMR